MYIYKILIGIIDKFTLKLLNSSMNIIVPIVSNMLLRYPNKGY